jgi:signal transduction histidine kinase/ligand-binding sensor domain-containing protein/DNA-binding response OmpR family regulator
MWFGMANGLYKFDLNSFTYFSLRKNKINGFPESDIRAIIEYAPGLLLVGTYNKGLLIYNAISERFDSVKCNSKVDFKKLFVRCLYADKAGIIWVGTSNGLIKLKYSGKQSNQFYLLEKFDKSNTQLIGEEFVGIMESKTGVPWFLTVSDICYFDKPTNKIKTFHTWDSNSSFTFTDHKKILIGCFGRGLKMFNTETLSFENIRVNGISNNSQVRYVYKDRQSNIWLSISNVGLMLIESGIENPKITFISNREQEYSSLNSNVIYQIKESRDGALWVCSEEGVNMISLKKNHFNSYPCNMPAKNGKLGFGIRALLNSEDGFIWTGTIGGGLKQFNVASKKYTDVSLVKQGKTIGRNIQVIMRDHKDHLWLGTEGEGVIKFIPDQSSGYKNGTIINYQIYPVNFPSKTLLNDYIMCLLEDRHKNIWIGTWHGLSLLDSSEAAKPDQSKAIIKNFLHNPSDNLSISNNTIMSLLEDNSGNIWVGTQEGLNKITKTPKGYKFEHNYKNEAGVLLTEKKILVSFLSKKNSLWFSTHDGGICYLNTKNGIYHEYNSDNGFNDYIVNSIAEDDLGNLWLGTNNGLCRFDPSNLSFNIYTTEDGLSSDIFFFASNCKVSNDLYFGGNTGITVFNPSNIIPSTFKPNLVFTDFRLFNKPTVINGKESPLNKHISNVTSVTLNYNQNFITIAFSALNYQQHQDIRYSCIMEGLESTWNNLGKERKITYNNLTPGHYLFKAKAYNSYDYNKFTEISLQVLVKPPFWKTTWAYLMYLSLFIYTLIQIYLFFLNKEKRKNALALERMNSKRVHEMDMMKLHFFTNISHEFRTPLTLLYAPLEALIKGNLDNARSQSYYQLMLRNVQRLKRLIDQLLDLRKIEEGYLGLEWNFGDIIEFIQKIYSTFQYYAEKRNIYFSFHSNISQLPTFFDADKLDKVLFNLLSNAFKYTPDYGTITLKLNEKEPSAMPYTGLTEKYLEIKLTDSGYGIPKESIDKLFHPFQQVNTNKPIDSAATGIGLALTKELVELHKGFINVESEVHKGSTFTIYLPIYKNKPQTGTQSNSSMVETHELESQDLLLHETIETDSNNIKSPGSKPMILIVEDNGDLRAFIKSELRNAYRLIESADGVEGFEQAISKIPDLIISDIMMDKMDGVELCRKLKADERTSHIPIILLTAKYSEEVKLGSYETGADDYITKPFNMTLLAGRIKNLIEQRRKLRKLFGKGNNFDFTSIATNKTDSQFIEKLNRIIDKNIANPDFNPSMLASEMAMSRMQLYRKVSALTNQTVYNYLRTIRLNKAAILLATTDMQIAEISLNVGYTEPTNFTRCFIRQFNQTPSQYARENRK